MTGHSNLPDPSAAEPSELEALAAAVDRYADMVYSTCRRVLGSESEAADVAQETFFQFFQPTVSRRVATALDALRAQLRARDVIVGVGALSAMLPASTQAAPVVVFDALAKMSLAQAASAATATASVAAAAGSSSGTKTVLAGVAMAVLSSLTWLAIHPGSSRREAVETPSSRIAGILPAPVDPNLAAEPVDPAAVPESGRSPMTPVPPTVAATNPGTGLAMAFDGGTATGGVTRWAVGAQSQVSGRFGRGTFTGQAGAYAYVTPGTTGSLEAASAQAGYGFGGVGFWTNPPAEWGPRGRPVEAWRSQPRPVLPPGAPVFGGRAAVSLGPPGPLVVHGQFDYPPGQQLRELRWRPVLPPGWRLADVSGLAGPRIVADEIVFSGPLGHSPILFNLNLEVPAGETGPRELGGVVEYGLVGSPELIVRPVGTPFGPGDLVLIPRPSPAAQLAINQVNGRPGLRLTGEVGRTYTLLHVPEFLPGYERFWWFVSDVVLTHATHTWVDETVFGRGPAGMYRAVLLE
jgi:hypothetical protein